MLWTSGGKGERMGRRGLGKMGIDDALRFKKNGYGLLQSVYNVRNVYT
jgi:hypothetical protein